MAWDHGIVGGIGVEGGYSERAQMSDAVVVVLDAKGADLADTLHHGSGWSGARKSRRDESGTQDRGERRAHQGPVEHLVSGKALEGAEQRVLGDADGGQKGKAGKEGWLEVHGGHAHRTAKRVADEDWPLETKGFGDTDNVLGARLGAMTRVSSLLDSYKYCK